MRLLIQDEIGTATEAEHGCRTAGQRQKGTFIFFALMVVAKFYLGPAKKKNVPF